MHYFVPPMQAAICVIQKRVIRGKMESVLEAKKLFPELLIFDELIDVVEKHYETPKLYKEPEISHLEEQLYNALTVIYKKLSENITVVDDAKNKQSFQWKQELSKSDQPSYLTVFDNTKWARQMRGRLHFYANAPDHFDSQWCIENELKRINNMFFVVPYSAFWQVKTGERPTDLLEVVKYLRGNLLSGKQADATIRYHELTSQKYQPCDYKKAALEIVEVYEDFYRGLYNLLQELKRIL